MIIGGWFKPGHCWRWCGLNPNHAVAGYFGRFLNS
jgi:hypothetical protein